jgi:hypothetical protein
VVVTTITLLDCQRLVVLVVALVSMLEELEPLELLTKAMPEETTQLLP